MILGVDEVGRGTLAGAVVAVALCIKSDFSLKIKDSKKSNVKQRIAFYNDIIDKVDFSVGCSSVSEIDNMNILKASHLAMRRAIAKFNLSNFQYVLVDGHLNPGIEGSNVYCIVKGDEKELSIMAASIVAKVIRDKMMSSLHMIFPEYGWNNNSGYGTKEHIDAIRKFGITCHHRKTFEPIKSMLL